IPAEVFEQQLTLRPDEMIHHPARVVIRRALDPGLARCLSQLVCNLRQDHRNAMNTPVWRQSVRSSFKKIRLVHSLPDDREGLSRDVQQGPIARSAIKFAQPVDHETIRVDADRPVKRSALATQAIRKTAIAVARVAQDKLDRPPGALQEFAARFEAVVQRGTGPNKTRLRPGVFLVVNRSAV